MLKRLGVLGMLLAAVASTSGCCVVDSIVCTHDRWVCRYNARHWCQRGCGETYWSEWFNDLPDCCDPCDRCGRFGRRCCRRNGCRPQPARPRIGSMVAPPDQPTAYEARTVGVMGQSYQPTLADPPPVPGVNVTSEE